MMPHIRRHSITVARISHFLCQRLTGRGRRLSVDLAVAGALLHDIAKTRCIENGGDHARIGEEICRRHGLNEIAPIVGEHVILRNGVSSAEVTEKEVVYYADKRVNHEQIVSLEERLVYIIDRYGEGDARRIDAIHRNFAVCRRVEEKVLAAAELAAAELAEIVNRLPDPFEP